MYILSTGCQWRAIPKDLPPRSTVHEYLVRWTFDGTLERMHHALYVKCREQAAREASPTAAIIDAQSVKSAEKGGAAIDPHGYDAGKKVKGKKRHVLVDTQGFVLHAIVTAADIQDRDGGAMLLATLFGHVPVSAEALCRWRLSGTSGIPSFSYEAKGVGENGLLSQHLVVSDSERPQPVLGHIGNEVIEQTTLSEQRMRAAFAGVGF